MPHIMSEFSLNILISFTELEVLPCRIFRPRAFDKGPVEGIGVHGGGGEWAYRSGGMFTWLPCQPPAVGGRHLLFGH